MTAYQACGSKTPGELLSVLPGSTLRTAVGMMMVIHIVVTYTIFQQVLTRATCLRFFPKALLDGPSAHMLWFMVSTSFMVGGWIVANAVPLFSDIMNITGSIFSTQ